MDRSGSDKLAGMQEANRCDGRGLRVGLSFVAGFLEFESYIGLGRVHRQLRWVLCGPYSRCAVQTKVLLLYRSFALGQLAATDLHWFKIRFS
jgi:hypothetical protein